MERNFIVLLGGQIFLVFGGLAIPPLIPFFQPELKLTYSEVGFIMTFMYLGAILMSLPAGWLTDHIGIKKTIVYSQLITGGFVALLGLGGNYGVMIFFTFLVGLGYGVSNPPTTKGIMVLVHEGNRGLAMSLKQTGVPIASALTAAVLPPLALFSSWRVSFVAAGAAVSVVGLLSHILYQPRMEHSHLPHGNAKERLATDWKQIIRNRNIVSLSIAGAFCALVQISLFTYTVLYLMDARKFELLQATFSLTLMSLGGIVGRVFWGAVSDRLFKGSRRIVLQILVAIIFGITLLLGLNIYLPSFLLVIVFFILGTSAIGWNGVFHAFIGEISGKEVVGLATGVSMTIVFMGGLIGPLLYGKIVDVSKSHDVAWLFLAAAMAAAFFFYSRIREKTLR
jgi:ACS family hexuronate transporter-like MFS transporter